MPFNPFRPEFPVNFFIHINLDTRTKFSENKTRLNEKYDEKTAKAKYSFSFKLDGTLDDEAGLKETKERKSQ